MKGLSLIAGLALIAVACGQSGTGDNNNAGENTPGTVDGTTAEAGKTLRLTIAGMS